MFNCLNLEFSELGLLFHTFSTHSSSPLLLLSYCSLNVRLCGLVVRVPGYRSGFPVLPDFPRSSGLERGPLSLMSITEELLGRKISGFGLEI
jgi:hypothetical protein